MSVSPSPERIEICTPPDSPNVGFCEAPSSLLPVTPPRALARRVYPRRGAKRRKRSSSSGSVDKPTNEILANDGSGELDISDVFGVHSVSVETFPDSMGLGRPMWQDDSDTSAQNRSKESWGELAPTSSTNASSESTGQGIDPYEYYADATLADCCGFFQISKNIFVVQGWDAKGQRSTVSGHDFQDYVESSLDYFQTSWHHIQRVRIGDNICVACSCHQSSQCFHERFLREYQEEKFPEDFPEDLGYDAEGRF
jgi:hypothetical protein